MYGVTVRDGAARGGASVAPVSSAAAAMEYGALLVVSLALLAGSEVGAAPAPAPRFKGER